MRRYISSIELLEPRIAPAALTAKLAGGVLKLSGDPAIQPAILSFEDLS